MILVWLISSAAVQVKRGFSHFHWLGDPIIGMDLVVGERYSGYVIRLVALETLYFRNHEAVILVKAGVDPTSHVQIAMDCQ
jgi:hypothetical protein